MSAPPRSALVPLGKIPAERGGSPPGGCRTPLSGERLAAAAIEIADTEGLAAVSMRRIAASLGVGTMTLYYHVRDKDELVGLMWDAFLAGHLLEEIPEGWREGLTEIARRTRQSFQRHPWALKIGIRPGFGPNKLRHIEQCLTVASKITDDPTDQLQIIHSIDDLAVGCTFRELSVQGDPDHKDRPAVDVDDPWAATALQPVLSVLVSDGEHPHLAALTTIGCGLRMPRFEQALGWLLDGIERAYAPAEPTGRSLIAEVAPGPQAVDPVNAARRPGGSHPG